MIALDLATQFDGTDDVIGCKPGACPLTLGNVSVAVITRTGGTVGNRSLFSVTAGATDEWGLETSSSARPQLWNGVGVAPMVATVAADSYYLIGVNKATGTVAPRFNLYDYATGAITRETAVNTLVNGTAPVSPTVHIGAYRGSSQFWNGHIALVGIWDRVLTDSEFDLLFTGGLREWKRSAPAVLLLLNKPRTHDLQGRGVYENNRVGTTLVPFVPARPFLIPGQTLRMAPAPRTAGVVTHSGVAVLDLSFFADTNASKVAVARRWGEILSSEILLLPKHNYTATVDPAAGDDSLDGYEVGSEWINNTNQTVWKCVSASVNAAVWVQTGG